MHIFLHKILKKLVVSLANSVFMLTHLPEALDKQSWLQQLKIMKEFA
jgi:hypothetical protein